MGLTIFEKSILMVDLVVLKKKKTLIFFSKPYFEISEK